MSNVTQLTRTKRAAKAAAVVLALAVPFAFSACTSTEAAAPAASAEPTATEAEVVTWEPTGDITWVVPYSPGGGFDTYSRGIAQVMQEGGHLPSGVNIVVRNETPLPQGIYSMYSAKPDGYTVGILPMPAAIAQEIQDPGVAKWETDKFTILGQVDSNAYVVYVKADSPFETIEDLIATKGLRTITVEKGSSSSLAGLATIAALDLDATITYGAEGSSEVVTAVLRGDADFFVYGSTDVVGFIESGDVRPLLFLGREEERSASLEWLKDVPSAEDAGFPELAGVVTEFRVIVAPPGLPDEVVAYLRQVLSDTMKSAGFVAWAETAKRPIVVLDYKGATAAVAAQIEKMKTLVPKLSALG
jgi:tripartite-type tricarboxylate transporter receptor subunit TctC